MPPPPNRFARVFIGKCLAYMSAVMARPSHGSFMGAFQPTRELTCIHIMTMRHVNRDVSSLSDALNGVCGTRNASPVGGYVLCHSVPSDVASVWYRHDIGFKPVGKDFKLYTLYSRLCISFGLSMCLFLSVSLHFLDFVEEILFRYNLKWEKRGQFLKYKHSNTRYKDEMKHGRRKIWKMINHDVSSESRSSFQVIIKPVWSKALQYIVFFFS